MEPLRTPDRHNDLENKDQSFSPLDFKTHYKVTGIKAVWYWHRNRCIALNTRIKNKETSKLMDSMWNEIHEGSKTTK